MAEEEGSNFFTRPKERLYEEKAYQGARSKATKK